MVWVFRVGPGLIQTETLPGQHFRLLFLSPHVSDQSTDFANFPSSISLKPFPLLHPIAQVMPHSIFCIIKIAKAVAQTAKYSILKGLTERIVLVSETLSSPEADGESQAPQRSLSWPLQAGSCLPLSPRTQPLPALGPSAE